MFVEQSRSGVAPDTLLRNQVTGKPGDRTGWLGGWGEVLPDWDCRLLVP